MSFPVSQRAGLAIEDEVISVAPNGPAGSNQDFHEHWVTKANSCINDHAKVGKVQVPRDANKVPTRLTEGADKKEMVHGFLHIQITNGTRVVLTVLNAHI